MRIPHLCFCLVILGTSLQTAWGFSARGHQFVGALAESILTERAKTNPRAAKALAKAHELLNGMSFMQAATIPDELKDWDASGKFAGNFPGLIRDRQWPKTIGQQLVTYFKTNSDSHSEQYHHKYHFADIPVGPGADLHYVLGAVGTNHFDIVQTLHYCEAKLAGSAADDGRAISPSVALILMIHLVGDLHQPLHIGSEYFTADGTPVNPTQAQLDDRQALPDVGGNNLQVDPEISPPAYGKPGNLHAAWDEAIPDRVFKAWLARWQATSQDPEVLAAAALHGAKLPPFATFDATAPWEAWASEAVPLSQQAHEKFVAPFKPLGKPGASSFTGLAVNANTQEDYDNWAEPIMETQLARAGTRLAWVIEETLGQ